VSRFLIHQRNQAIQCHSRRYTLENTEDKLKIQTIQKLNTTQKTNSAKHNYPGSVVSYDTRPGHEVGPHGVQYM